MENSNLTIEKGSRQISEINEWFEYGEPKGGSNQWKIGRSAFEFARYMTSYDGAVPSAIMEYLKSIGIQARSFKFEPERITPFCKKGISKFCPGWNLGSGEGRHHDGFMWPLDDNECVISFEAKVSEPFDRSIKDRIEAAKKNHDQGENAKQRILESIRVIKGEKDTSADWHKNEDLMYQLLSATIGTVIEAKKLGATNAVFLVIEFTGNVCKEKNYDAKVDKNRKDFDNYMEFLGLGQEDDKGRNINIDGINVWFKRLSINIGKAEYSAE